DIWFQLKTARSLLNLIDYFEKNNELHTVYDQANFYIDKNHHVKVLISTKELHLPHDKNASEHIEFIRELLIQIFSKSYHNDEFIEKIKQSNEVTELKQIIEDKYDSFLSDLDTQRENSEKHVKRTKIKYLLV